MTAAFVDEHRDRWPVVAMCAAIGRVWKADYSCYGPRRVYKQLRREDYAVARCTVGRLMADMGIRGVQRGRKRFTTVLGRLVTIRLHGAIGDMPPAEHEAAWYRHQNAAVNAA